MKRIILVDEIDQYNQLTTHLSTLNSEVKYVVDNNWGNYITPGEKEYIFNDDEECIVLVYNKVIYDEIRGLHNNGDIRIGLRRFDYLKVLALTYLNLNINKAKVIFSRDVKFNYWDDKLNLYTDSKLNYFLSDDMFSDAIEIPEIKIGEIGRAHV